MTDFTDGRVADKTLDIMLQEQVVVHSNMTQATAPICDMTIKMTEKAKTGRASARETSRWDIVGLAT